MYGVLREIRSSLASEIARSVDELGRKADRHSDAIGEAPGLIQGISGGPGERARTSGGTAVSARGLLRPGPLLDAAQLTPLAPGVVGGRAQPKRGTRMPCALGGTQHSQAGAPGDEVMRRAQVVKTDRHG